MENPHRYMTPKVPTSDSGTAIAGISVAGTLRRKTNITITTSATASSNSNWTSWTEARMVVVRSVNTLTSTVPGSAACSCGRTFLMRSTVSMTFAPGWRWIFRMIAGVLLAQAASLAFSAPSITSAISRKRIGAPFFQTMTRSRYSAADFSWSLASRVEARIGPSKLPFAMLTLALPMTVRTSSRLIPLAASALGFA